MKTKKIKVKSFIEIQVYETPTGEPTCARNFRTGETCRFLLSQRMGTEYLCGYSEWGCAVHDEPLEISKNGEGYLIPCAKCPLHDMVSGLHLTT